MSIYLSIYIKENFKRMALYLNKDISPLFDLCKETLITNMEFYAYPFSSSSSSSTSSFAVSLKILSQLTVKTVFGNLICVTLGVFFAVVGTLLGAVTGGILGQKTETGFFRGAAVGAITGALLSIEVFESFRRLWLATGKGMQCVLYLIDVLGSLVSGRLVRERVGPMMMSAVHSHMSGIEASFEDVMDIFETGGCKGLSRDIVEMIPKTEITSKNHTDSWGEKISCSVCLEDFQLGEMVRSLPLCHHLFHPCCIDQWLVRRASCPLCRRDL